MNYQNFLTSTKFKSKSSNFLAVTCCFCIVVKESFNIPDFKYIINYPSSEKFNIFYYCIFIIRIINECNTFSPSSRKRSKITFEKDFGLL